MDHAQLRVASAALPAAHRSTVPTPLGRPRWRYAGHKERWRLGGAFYMAREVAAQLPEGARLLDVGCGDGFITHHLSSLLRAPAVGIDVRERTAAPVGYTRFDGEHIPHADQSFDAALCAYVLHHAADAPALIGEIARVLVVGGTLVVYEDVPGSAFDRLLCWRHDRAWRSRSGRCTFHLPRRWVELFAANGFALRLAWPLSRFRDLTNPVARQFLVFERVR